MITNILLIILGIFWGTLIEWLLHKYILHALAAKLKASFHLEHHITSAKYKGKDPDYNVIIFKSTARLKEAGALLFISLIHLPILFIYPMFFVGNMIVVFGYYFSHYLMHKYPSFGWRWFPWHMEHHLVSAKKNFGVTNPFWDWVFGTLIIVKK